MGFLKTATTRRSRCCAAIFGCIIAFSAIVGHEVYETNSIAGLYGSTSGFLIKLTTFLLVWLTSSIALALLLPLPSKIRWNASKATWKPLSTRRAFFIVWLIMFTAWIPCLLAYWPGPFSYDIPTQTNYIFTGHWTTQQPPLHTLIWAAFLQMEGVFGLKAITWYCLGSMLFLSGCFSYTLQFLAKRGINKVLWILCLVFYALNPVVALFSIIPVKDSLLAGFITLFTIGVCRVLSIDKTPMRFPQRVSMIASALVCCLLRSNMLIAFALFALIMCIIQRNNAKTIATLTVTPLVLALAITGPVYSAAGITSGSSAIASVPFQQVVNVVAHHKNELSAEELATVEAIVPVDKAVREYNPRFADKVVHLFKGKRTGTAALKEQLGDFAFLWLRWIPKYPQECLDAFLALNIPYWYPLAQTPDPYSQRAYIETSIWKETEYYPITLESKLPAVHQAYEGVADYSALSNPLANMLFSPSSVIWALLIAFFCLCCSSRKRNALVVLLPLVFWLSFMIGPVSNMRYVFPLFSLYPLLACFVLQPGQLLEGER